MTVGVDLGKRKSEYTVVEENGTRVVIRKLPNQRELVQKFLRSLPGTVGQVGCETCTNTYWLVETVEEIGLRMRVGHALKLRLIAESRIKTDRIDSGVIADLLRANFFPDIAIPPREVRQVRELLRGRINLARSAAQSRNRLHGVLTRAGVEYKVSEAGGVGVEAWLDGVGLSPSQRFMAQHYVEAERELRKRIAAIEEELKRQVHPVEPWASILKRLQTIPGVGEFSALVLLLELWEITRFPTAKKLASYVGIVPGVHQTGQTLRGGRLTKQGNRYVRWILVQDAWIAIRWCPRYRGLHEHHTPRQGRTGAIIPVARQILADVFEIWRNNISYDDLVARRTRKSA